ncbi:MAG: dienelactone hydrolase family protein [Verrucomicrobia bacterium]|nr:dienelactone hydrolase family protein [Verrucomicrobiota bacterium]
MHTEKIPYFHGETKCVGFLAYDDNVQGRRPAVLVSPAWRGQDDFARQKAIELAQLGYVGFAIDMYGNGLSVTDEEAGQYMVPLFLDRSLLQGRIKAGFECVRKLPAVDPLKIGAIGFCFGGLTVYELLRSGADVKGVVCFHGVFANVREGVQVQTVPISPEANGSLLILQGEQDPLVSVADLQNVQQEMTKAGIDWQIHLYGNTMHAFTNPLANNPKNGAMYSEKATKRSWRSCQDFFAEVF